MTVSTASLVKCRSPTAGRARGSSRALAEGTEASSAHERDVNTRAAAPCSHARRLIATILYSLRPVIIVPESDSFEETSGAGQKAGGVTANAAKLTVRPCS